MGVNLKCKCENCGFEKKDIQLGSTPYSFELESFVPSICYDCKLLFTSDIEKSSTIKCPSCKKRTKLVGLVTTDMDYLDKYSVLFDWSVNYDFSNPVEKVFVLEDKDHKCPYCNENKLTFYDLQWD
jgi:DNA-directed RNA polymerase subunit M/transcription elongation factor TFIIS